MGNESMSRTNSFVQFERTSYRISETPWKMVYLCRGASGIHSVCIYEHHQNFKLLISEIPEISDCKELLSKIVCNIVTAC